MAIVSGGELILSDTVTGPYSWWYQPTTRLHLANQTVAYGSIYERQLWVYTLVRKRALATRRLPLKVYERQTSGRPEVRDDSYSRLLRQPNPRHSGSFLWEWTSSTFDIYGEAMWLKMRGRDGTPRELWPMHPANMIIRKNDVGDLVYVFMPGGYPNHDPQYEFASDDVVHFKSYHPTATMRGLSPLEPLRLTLVNEDGMRRASSSFWENGARPATWLTHPNKLSPAAAERLQAQFSQRHGGVDNWSKTAVLEEGLEPHFERLDAEELQYIDSRRLNREEVCAAYDVPPPVVHILDRATFSNITEQMRSMYRDTMAPHLSGFEATLDQQLRPDFDPFGKLYAEFLMDEVLRGDFENRVNAYQAGVNSGWLTPAEVREMENLPPIDGADKLFINAALIPIDQPSIREQPTGLPPGDVPLALPVGKSMRDVMGRLSRVKSLGDIDPVVLTEGLNGLTDRVLDVLATARVDGVDVAELRRRLTAAGKE